MSDRLGGGAMRILAKGTHLPVLPSALDCLGLRFLTSFCQRPFDILIADWTHLWPRSLIWRRLSWFVILDFRVRFGGCLLQYWSSVTLGVLTWTFFHLWTNVCLMGRCEGIERKPWWVFTQEYSILGRAALNENTPWSLAPWEWDFMGYLGYSQGEGRYHGLEEPGSMSKERMQAQAPREGWSCP